MALREQSRPVPTGRSGRHGRPRPFGGRLRLPTIRFSGAAMAMSTVVGISLATTWLLNEQQQIGRRPGVTVGGPPAPSPDGSPAGTPAGAPAERADTVQAAPATVGTSAGGAPSGAPSSTTRPAAAGSPAPVVRAVEQQPTRPTAATPSPTAAPSASPSPAASTVSTASTGGPTRPQAGPVPLAARPSAPVTASPSPSPSPSPSAPLSPRPDVSVPLPPALGGTAWVDALGRAGTRHTLQLRLDESMTALQVEFRLNRPSALPGTAPATDLPGAVATIALEQNTLVYRFTTPPDVTLPPGGYTFTVTGAIAAPSPTAPEGWTASAFALSTPRAVAARGSF